jgi:hypothetical protein
MIQLTEDPASLGATNYTTQTFFGASSPLNATLPDFQVIGVRATSNSGSPLMTTAQLLLTAGEFIPDSGSPHTIQIIISDNAFTFPTGGNYVLNSSSTDTSIVSATTDTDAFQSFVDPAAMLFGRAIGSPGVTYQLGNRFNSAVENATAFSSNTPFALTSITTYDAVSGGGILMVTGSTTVSVASLSVPEPRSALLLGVGLIGVLGLFRGYRRRG